MENFNSWVKKYTKDLYDWAYYKTSSPETAEDLVQDTFLAATEKLSSFKKESSAKTWLFSILNHKIIDYFRKKVKSPEKIDDGFMTNYFDEDGQWRQNKQPKDWQHDDKHPLDDDDFQNVLKNCLDKLPEKWNICIKYKYLTDKKGDEICQELELSPTNYWQIIHRAKLELRNCIEKNWYKN